MKVSSDKLRIYDSPSAKGKAAGYTGKGTFTIVQVKGDWGKLKSGAGWINLADKSCSTAGSASSSKVSYMVKVMIPDLRIRKAPGTDAAWAEEYTGKGFFTIVEEASEKGVTKLGLLKSYQKNRGGWISLDYVR